MSFRRAALFFLVPLTVIAACGSDDDHIRFHAAPGTTVRRGRRDTTAPAAPGHDRRATRDGSRDLARQRGRTVPRRPLRGQQGRRHHHLPVELRLRRIRIDRRRPGRQREGLLRGHVPRRDRQGQLLDRQLSVDRGQRGPVLVGRIVQRGGRLRRPQRCRFRSACRRRSHRHRRLDRQGRRRAQSSPI